MEWSECTHLYFLNEYQNIKLRVLLYGVSQNSSCFSNAEYPPSIALDITGHI